MGYEKIVLECLSRIQSLEENVKTLEEKVTLLEQTSIDGNNDEQKSKIENLSKSEYLKKVQDKILSISNSRYVIRKGNRSEGAGIVIKSTVSQKSYNVKVFVSKSHLPEYKASGWFGVMDKDFKNSNIDFFVFAVAGIDNTSDYYFIFSHEELVREFGNYISDTTEKKHIYLRLDNQNRAIETRHDEKDMSNYFENWNIFMSL